MTDLTAAIALWGMAYGVRDRSDESARASHQLARAAEHGVRSRRAWVERKLAGRDGISRRALMAQSLASCGRRVVPKGWVAPVPCKDDSGRHKCLSVDPLETAEVKRIQAAWELLQKSDADHGTMFARVFAVAHQRADLPTRRDKAKALGISEAKYDQDLKCAHAGMRIGWAMALAAERWEGAK